MADVRRLTVRGRYDCIPSITSFVAEAAEAAGLNEDEAFHCRMAADEACTNIIEHAYGGEDIGAIEVTCNIEPGVCAIQIVDTGRRFDPDAVPQPTFPSNIEDVRPGGIGLHLMRKMMDQVSFQFSDERNTLTMIKSHATVPGTEAGTQPEAVPVKEVRPNVWLVSPTGRLDAASSPSLEERLTEMLQMGRNWLVIDMGGISYISSRGLKTLISAWRKSGDAGGTVLLFGMVPRVASIFETVGFTHIFDSYETLDEALAAVETLKRP